ncbi:hypothetical protein CNR22_11885 [Sphingobacteriaceae bacterium]|nr:hypothetical protein CNR22_11885 [Sphingobacteriaceae bacterium]
MKTLFKFFFFFTGVLFLSSCEDVVQIKLDEGSKLYVIDAFVNDLPGKQTIRVLTNDNYFSNREAPPVAGANVLLKDLTDGSQYVFTDAGNGNYVYNVGASEVMSKRDHQYELNVSIDGTTYTSLTTQKRTAVIDSISAEYDDGTSGFGSAQPAYFCGLWAKDKVDANVDYYWIKTSRNDTLFDDINICIDGTGGPVTDASFDSTYFTPPATFLGFRSYQSGNTCKVEVHSIARETYYFFVQAQAQINNGGLFATTPENVKTNIVTPADAKTKAVGWFNMASVATKTKVIP